MPDLPLIAPNPPRLSEMGDALRAIEASGIFSNNGPQVRAFEAEITDQLFGGHGASLAVANATLGLMIAIRDAGGQEVRPGRQALMPALTFAATGHAAEWAGFQPLIADIDPADWGIAAKEEERLLRESGGRIAVVVPYATFGSAIDLDRYAWLQRRFEVGVVVDAASSLGTLGDDGAAFGARAPFAVVHSMHATKTFAVAEGGLIHSGDEALIARLRSMTNFGFDGSRSAAMPGINAKLPEVLAAMARAKLAKIDEVADRRAAVETAYREALDGFDLQAAGGRRRAMQFMPVLLPAGLATQREGICHELEAAGIGCGRYFSPHLGEQPWFRRTAECLPTPVADEVAGRMLSLPITDFMTPADAHAAAAVLVQACRTRRATLPARPYPPRETIARTLVVGGGPAGSALLTAASKHGRLRDLARGLVVVERDAYVGGGRLGRYAITSDSTAATFLTAVANNPEPALAALARHPAAEAVSAHAAALGVPLAEVGPLLRATGERLTDLVREAGGRVLTGHEALGATRTTDGLWRVSLRRVADGEEFTQLTRSLVVATGGHQPLDRLVRQEVAGAPLLELADDRLVQSDEVLALGGYERVADLIAAKRAPRIAVIGGSTSALTTIALLLKGRPPLPLGAGAVTLLHRRPLRPFYHSVEAAHAEGFTDFGPEDICPVSGFVYRLAGFRLEARDLVLRMLGVDGRAPDPRVTLHRIQGDDAAARQTVRDADLVIAALGYRPVALPLTGADGRAIDLAARGGAPMVDRHCRIVGDNGTPLPDAYGIGLAAGFVPWGRLGGEASFSGQANGLWLWQNDVGMMIVDQLLAHEARAAA